MGVDAVLTDPDVDIVVNLTIPAMRRGVGGDRCAGKRLDREADRGGPRGIAPVLEKADAANLRVGVAPDTVLGPSVQTAKRAIERGDIDRPLYAQTAFQWQERGLRPTPPSSMRRAAVRCWTLGRSHVSALVHVFGPVASIAARPAGHADAPGEVGELTGQEFPVEIPSTLSVLMDFEQGGGPRACTAPTPRCSGTGSSRSPARRAPW